MLIIARGPHCTIMRETQGEDDETPLDGYTQLALVIFPHLPDPGCPGGAISSGPVHPALAYIAA